MKTVTGFTLTELTITVAIVGILAAIAYPSYVDQVRKACRADAQAALVELAQFMERINTQNLGYVDSTGQPIKADSLPFTCLPEELTKDQCENATTRHYKLDLDPPTTVTTFTLIATPKGVQQDDVECGVLTLTNRGVKCIQGGVKCSTQEDAGVKEAVMRCWGR